MCYHVAITLQDFLIERKNSSANFQVSVSCRDLLFFPSAIYVGAKHHFID